MHRFRVKEQEQGQRLQRFLHSRLDQRVSLRTVKRWLDERRCRVGGRIERFAGHVVVSGELIELVVQERAEANWKVLFEDEWLTAYNKPAGCCFDAGPSTGFWVHRLDRDTSGILLVAKNAQSQEKLEALFQQRRIFKRYLAVVYGCPQRHRGVVKNRLGRVGMRAGQPVWGPAREGKTAITRYQVLAQRRGRALIGCVPETGRTHQVRVHMTSLGCPIVGDIQYGSRAESARAGRHLLHAHRLVFDHPFTGDKMRLEAAPSKEFCV